MKMRIIHQSHNCATQSRAHQQARCMIGRGARSLTVAALTCAIAIAAPAAADLLLLYGHGGPVHPTQGYMEYNAQTGGWDVHLNALYNPAGETVYEVHGTGGEIVDNIFINVPCWEWPPGSGNCVPAGSPVIVRVRSQPPLGLRTVHNIIQTGDAETLLNIVEVTEDIGQITAEAIGILNAGRDVIGPITATSVNNSMRGVSFVNAGRDILGDILATDGRILSVTAQRHIGDVNGKAAKLHAKHGALEITAGGDVHAEVRAGLGAGGTGHLARLQCQRFFGSVRATRLAWNASQTEPGCIHITGEFAGSMKFNESFTNASHTIELPPASVGGLGGQIVINAAALPNGAWNAPIKLGPVNAPGGQIVLNGPTYPHTSASLGGGAVGLVPFQLHYASCNPPGGGSVVAPASGTLAIDLDHYGPVTWLNNPPLTVSRRPAGSLVSFSSLPPGDFLVERAPDNPKRLLVRGSQAASGAGKFEPGYEYRILPSPELRCELPDISPANAPAALWPFPYTFTVTAPPCPGDVNGNGIVDVVDMLVLFAFWGPIDSNAPFAPLVDLNGDGMVDVLDLLLLFANWGACE